MTSAAMAMVRVFTWSPPSVGDDQCSLDCHRRERLNPGGPEVHPLRSSAYRPGTMAP